MRNKNSFLSNGLELKYCWILLLDRNAHITAYYSQTFGTLSDCIGTWVLWLWLQPRQVSMHPKRDIHGVDYDPVPDTVLF